MRETTDRFWRNEENCPVLGDALTHAQFAPPLANEIRSAIALRILNRQKRLRETEVRIGHVFRPLGKPLTPALLAPYDEEEVSNCHIFEVFFFFFFNKIILQCLLSG